MERVESDRVVQEMRWRKITSVHSHCSGIEVMKKL